MTIPKAIFFDLDDTLYDHTTVSRIALTETSRLDETLSRVSFEELEKANAHWLEHFHRAVQEGNQTLEAARVARWARILDQFGSNVSNAPLLAASQRRAYLANERLVEGTREVLSAFAKYRLPLAIVSNNTREEQLGKLARLGIADRFQAVIVSADHGIAKPDARLFHIALESMGHLASEVVHIGDSWNADVGGANAAGIRPIWFNRFGKTSPDSGVEQIRNLCELIDVLGLNSWGSRDEIPVFGSHTALG